MTAPHLPAGVTFEDCDALCRDLTADELATMELEDPTRFGLCTACALAGEREPACPGCDFCAECMPAADLDAIEDRLAELANAHTSTTAEGALLRDYLRDATTLLVEVRNLRRVVEREAQQAAIDQLTRTVS